MRRAHAPVRHTLLLGLIALLLPSESARAQPVFVGLGDLSGGATNSSANAVSSDGTVVTGSSAVTAGTEAYRWTSGPGIESLGILGVPGSPNSIAHGASADGAVVVGASQSASGYQAFRWTSAGGMIALGDLAGGSFYSEAYGVSADGSIVVGAGTSGSGSEAFLWTSGGAMVGLGDLAGGGFFSSASGVSADGSVVVGNSENAVDTHAFRWTSGGGMVNLGDLAGGFDYSEAYGVSADGSTVVGASDSTSGAEAFRWTSGTGMVGLGQLAGGVFGSEATAVSGDGSTVVGSSDSASGYQPFIWDASNGMRELATVLSDLGLDLTGWTLTSVADISADGFVIVGTGTNPSGFSEAWIASLGPPPPHPDRFLTYFSAVASEHEESTTTAQAYHAAIDPADERLDLSDWLTVNGFAGGADAEAIYVNEADLGFGRHMFIKTHVDGRVASYVKNHGDDTSTGAGDDPVDGPAEEKIANAHAGTNLIATVAMEYGPPPSDPGGTPYTRFYAFDSNGDRLLSADLDGQGQKFLPGVCTVCHGGNPRQLLPDGSYADEGDTGAGFLPWDLDTFGFSDTLFDGLPRYNKASQQAALKTMNAAVLLTNPTETAREVVEGWYGGAGLPATNFDGTYVPPGWTGHEDAYREVFAPNCRACHVMRNPAVAFRTHTEFSTLVVRAQDLVFDRGIMPLARRTYERFWTGLLVSDPAVVDLLGSVLATRRPGSGVPFAFAGPDRPATVGTPHTLDASDSSYATGFAWTLLSAPFTSVAALDDPTASNPSFTPDLVGDYVFQLTASNVVGIASDTVTVNATADGRLAGVDFASEVEPIFQSSCVGCHSGVGAAPDFNGSGSVAGSPEYTEAVYRSFSGRASVIDPPDSLLLRKSSSQITHGGGAALGSGSANYAVVRDWIAQGALRTTTPSYQRTDGSIVHPIKTISGATHAYAGPKLEPGATLSGAELIDGYLVAADLGDAVLASADLYNSNLTLADLSAADLSNADLGLADLNNADLSNAIGVTPAQIESAISLYGVSLANLDLSGINLAGRSVRFANLSGVDLSGANLSNADLRDADLTGALLTGALLDSANLDTTNLANADLGGASLTGADLSYADLSSANLAAANLTSSIGLALALGSPSYDLTTDFTGTGFDPVAAGWTLVSAGAVPSLGWFGAAAICGLLGLAGHRRLGGLRR